MYLSLSSDGKGRGITYPNCTLERPEEGDKTIVAKIK